MMFDGINLLAVAAAAVTSFVFGGAWYGFLGNAWMKAAGLTREDTKPSASIMIIAFLCQLLMAFVFAGVILHVGGASIRTGLISAALIWAGFILTSLTVNHRFQGKPWSLTIIDSGHWLGVLIVQGLVIGWIG